MSNEHYCRVCERVTRWVAARKGSRAEKCVDCGDRFPCAHACQHLDCRRERAGVREGA